MKRYHFFLLAGLLAVGTYQAGRYHPADSLIAAAKAEAFSAGRDDVIASAPKTKPTADQCIAWWNNSDIKAAKRRFCGK